jgi:hypothetical protein
LRFLGWLVVLAGIGGAAYRARPDLFAFLRSPSNVAPGHERCKPIPVSPMDPQPGLAPFRCAPDVPSPIVEPDSWRSRYGDGSAPPASGRDVEATATATLRRVADERDRAFSAFVQAQRAGDVSADAKHAAYMRAEARLDGARRALIANH